MFVDLLARPSGLLKRMYRVFWYSFDTSHEIIISAVRFFCRIAWSTFIVNYIFTEWIVWKLNMKMSFYCLQVNNIHIHLLTLRINLLLPSFSETLRGLLRLYVIRLLTCSWTLEEICHFINNSRKFYLDFSNILANVIQLYWMIIIYCSRHTCIIFYD